MKRTSTGASEPTIVCTHCGREMKLTETIAAPLIATARAKLAAEGKQRDEMLATRERTIKEATTALARGRTSLDEEIETRLEAERQALATKAAETAREEQAAEMQSLRDELEEKKGKIGTGQKSEIELRKKLRAAEDKAAEMEHQK